MEFILTFIIIIVLFVWLIGKFFPLIIQWYVKKKINKMGGSPKYGYGDDIKNAKKREGEVTITGAQNKEKVIKKDVGEYIDFEENE